MSLDFYKYIVQYYKLRLCKNLILVTLRVHKRMCRPETLKRGESEKPKSRNKINLNYKCLKNHYNYY